MQQIIGIQRREPYSHSASSYSNFNHVISSDELTIKKQSGNKIQLIFKRTSHHGQGVGLTLPSTEAATSLVKALLMVLEGHTTDVTVAL